jgi:hypothetical protein
MLGPLARICRFQIHGSSALDQWSRADHGGDLIRAMKNGAEASEDAVPKLRWGLTFGQATAKLREVSDLRERLQATLGSAYTIQRELGGSGMSRVFPADYYGRLIDRWGNADPERQPVLRDAHARLPRPAGEAGSRPPGN